MRRRRPSRPKDWKTIMKARTLLPFALGLQLVAAAAASSADYAKRAQVLDPSLQMRLVGKWTNPVDGLVIEITAIDLQSGKIKGTVSPTSGPAAANEHELIGWISAAPVKENFDNVIPISFSTSLYEYGTLPVWAGYLKGDKIVTMHYLVWPNKSYTWDHISAFQETWTKIP
jgi:hypothetical protein